MKRMILISIFGAFAALSTYKALTQPHGIAGSQHEIRAALDIGSGATKLKVAQVDLKTNKISKVLFEKVLPIPFEESLEESKDTTFSAEIMNQGIAGLLELKNDAKEQGAKKVVALATAAFRKAKNAPQYIQEIKEKTGITVIVFSQTQEGKIAFRGAIAECDVACFNTAVVWDIGGGSFQLTTENEKDEVVMSKGTFASVAFQNYIITKIQGKQLSKKTSTPNPITREEANKAIAYAKEFSQQIDPYIRQKVKNKDTLLIGVGGVFVNGIRPLIGRKWLKPSKLVLTQQKLDELIAQFLNLNDEEVAKEVLALKKSHSGKKGGLKPPPKSIIEGTVSNLLYVKGFMEGLGVDQLSIYQVNNANGLLATPEYWR